MKLTEVPEDLTLNAAVAMSAHGLSREPAGADGSESCLCGATPDDWDAHLAEVALAAVLPAHERQVREQVAAEIMAKAAEYADTLTGPRASFRRGMEAAARHVLPEPTVREIADAIANGDAVFCDLPDDAERGES